jgi:hypothetical protein
MQAIYCCPPTKCTCFSLHFPSVSCHTLRNESWWLHIWLHHGGRICLPRPFFYLLKGPAADATDAQQPCRLIVQPCDEAREDDDEVLLLFRCNAKPVEWNWQGKTKYSEKNLSQCHFAHHKSHMDGPGIEPGPPRWASTSCGWRWSYSALSHHSVTHI